MSLLDTASLIVTPNGYKEGKLYSVIPSDGSGDLSVTRATTATRVNSAGLVELVPYNLLSYSEDFSNAYWTKQNLTISANAITAPNGTMTADAFIASNGTAIYKGVYITEQTAVSKTLSFYAKKGNKDWAMLLGYNGTNNVWFNVSNGTIGTIGSNFINATIDSVGNGWYRCSATLNSSITLEPNVGIYASNADNSTSCTGDGTTASLYIWGAQLVEGSVAKDYQKTETRLNIPRLDYSNGTCPSILVEPQRTNLLAYSSSFDNAYWLKQGGGSASAPVVTANAEISPDGTMNADRIVFNLNGGTGSNDFSQISSPTITHSAASYIRSFYARTTDGTTKEFNFVSPSDNFEIISITPEYQRFDALSTIAANGGFRLRIRGNETSTNSASIALWGAQYEAGAYPTSYIPTTSASVTRNADVISKTGISSLIGQTEGTLFLDYTKTDAQQDIDILYSLGGANNDISIAYIFGGLRVLATTGGVTQFNNSYSGYNTSGRFKIAIAYQTNNVRIYINGVLIDTINSATFNFTNELNLGTANSNFLCQFYINASALWKQPLTNTQLAQLTTL